MVKQQQVWRTYAGLWVVPGPAGVLVEGGLAELTLGPRPAVAAAVTHAAAHAARGFEPSDVEVAGFRVAVAVAP